MTDNDLRSRVERVLRLVRDPEADVSAFEAGLIDDLRVADGDVVVEVDLNGFDPEAAEAVSATMVRAIDEVEGVDRVHVERVDRRPAPAGRSAGIASADWVVAVGSAKGGVGKSTVTTHLACALAATGRSVGLFDADIHGPNVPELLDLSGPVYSDDEGRPLPVATDGLEVMSVGFMASEAPLAWRGAMAHDALSELLEETAWVDPEVVVIDLPPGSGDVVLTTLQEVAIDGVVFVTTPFQAAITDTHRSVQLFEENDVPVLGVVSNMDAYVCDDCGNTHALFEGSDPVDHFEAPLLARLAFDPAWQRTPAPAPGGVPAVAEELADAVLDRLDDIWSVEVPAGAVDLRGTPPEERHDRVASAFVDLDPGETFHLVSDRDPRPVRGYLIELLDAEAGALEPVEVRRQNPTTWHLRAQMPDRSAQSSR